MGGGVDDVVEVEDVWVGRDEVVKSVFVVEEGSFASVETFDGEDFDGCFRKGGSEELVVVVKIKMEEKVEGERERERRTDPRASALSRRERGRLLRTLLAR